MNKLYKFLIAGIFTIIGLGSFSNANYTNPNRTEYSFNTSENRIYFEFTVNSGVVCYMPQGYGTNSNFKLAYLSGGFDNNSNLFPSTYYGYNMYCFDESFGIKYIGNGTLTNTNRFYIFTGILSDTFLESCQSEECDYSDYLTQEQCNDQYSGYIEQSTINSEYCLNNNLCYSCPTINKGYCKSEYNLIEPSECPICEGTGQINWSSLYINGTQYNSNEIIDIHTEQQMETSIEYSNTVADIDISYGQDEEYLDNVISYTQMTPTNEDLATLLSNGLQTYAPYLFIGLLLIFTIALIKKFFRG